ncbi:cysteine hydrolase [Bifidobacterium sp. 7101]|uniref:cysteine hydrolase n=1 Tax=Bifidobacterium sp. 7101 TaxID=1394175 RepID=UPI0003FFE1FA|nr:cysteine hydrolase [Bifidobacterium sp. 7101]
MINDDEWLVVIDRQEVFAHNEWSRWACSDGTYYQTNKNYIRLAKAYGDRVAYTRYIAPQPPKGVWVEYMNEWPEFQVPSDDPMYDLTPETAELAKGHPIVSLSTFGKWGPELQAAIKGSQKIALCGVATDACVLQTALAAADQGIAVRLVADACAGSTPENHKLAIDTMALFTPLITITDTDSLLRDLQTD